MRGERKKPVHKTASSRKFSFACFGLCAAANKLENAKRERERNNRKLFIFILGMEESLASRTQQLPSSRNFNGLQLNDHSLGFLFYFFVFGVFEWETGVVFQKFCLLRNAKFVGILKNQKKLLVNIRVGNPSNLWAIRKI